MFPFRAVRSRRQCNKALPTPPTELIPLTHPTSPVAVFLRINTPLSIPPHFVAHSTCSAPGPRRLRFSLASVPARHSRLGPSLIGSPAVWRVLSGRPTPLASGGAS